MYILKLGGSVITKKDSSKSEINEENLKRIAREIKNANIDNLIIIHGAGSFGHPPAKKYKIGEKFDPEEYDKKRIGFCLTSNEVKKLNMLICEAFIEEELPVIAISPSSVMTSKNKRIEHLDTDLIVKYLEKGYIPVMYGDVVLDSNLEMAVISGDQIIQFLARDLNVQNVILSTDVDGIYNKNPKIHDDAVFVEKFSSIEELETLEGSTSVDVTGGMAGKIKELLSLADLGINSQIINANIENNIYKALKNEKVKGTIISKAEE